MTTTSTRKAISIPSDCEGALQTAIRIRIIYLQNYRKQIHTQWLKYASDAQAAATMEANSLKKAENAIMQDITNLTMISDNLSEAMPM